MVIDNVYEIQEAVGSGSGSIIYRAYHKRLKKYVILKQIRSEAREVIGDRHEADLLKNLKHSYLPQVYDFLIIDGKVYTVMDYIPGRTLKEELIASGRLNQRDVIKWAIQLCEALCYLHKQIVPIIHSDIKPSNIMLTPQGDICLIDFNVSLLFADNLSVIGHSISYAAPEQSGYKIEGSSNKSKGIYVDERSDIYSLAATLYHLVTGEKPSSDYCRIKPLSKFHLHISDGLKHIITKGMQLDPDRRYQSAEEMLHALQGIAHLDRRYSALKIQREIVTILIICALAGFSGLTRSGYYQMFKENADKYNIYIQQGMTLQSQQNYKGAKNTYITAIEFMPENLEAYYHMTYLLYQEEKYEECISYGVRILSDSSYKVRGDEDGSLHTANINFVIANCYFEEEDYKNAAAYFNRAIEKNKENSEYYRDLAISYARLKNPTSALMTLETAEDLGLKSDSISLVKGEICFSKGDYAGAEKEFLSVIKETKDDYIKMRAYMVCDNMYKASKQTFNDVLEKEINLLEDGAANLTLEHSSAVTDMLADAYIRKGNSDVLNSKLWWGKAVKCFETLINRGDTDFTLMQNCAILYHQIGNYDKAESMLLNMEKKYPEDYRVYMRLAFLYADEQLLIQNENRNYSKVKEYYDKAEKLYEKSSKNGKSDPEMQKLNNMILDLKNKDWL